jgi:hypothetical protein
MLPVPIKKCDHLLQKPPSSAIREIASTTFSGVLVRVELLLLARNAHSFNPPEDNRMIYQGVEIELDSIGKVYQAAMKKIQRGMELACAADPLPEDFCSHIHDPGDTASIFAAAPMATQPLMESSLRRMLNDKDLFPGGPGSPLVVGVAQQKLKEFHAINLNLMLAMFIGGGMPSRGTEFISIAIAPRSMVRRHVFLESSSKGPRIRTKIAYNKVSIYVSSRLRAHQAYTSP